MDKTRAACHCPSVAALPPDVPTGEVLRISPTAPSHATAAPRTIPPPDGAEQPQQQHLSMAVPAAGLALVAEAPGLRSRCGGRVALDHACTA